MRKPFAALSIAFLVTLVLLGCGGAIPAAPMPDVNVIVSQTMAALRDPVGPAPVDEVATAAAQTVAAALTRTAVVAVDETPALAETAPDPLPVNTTGVLLNNGECFDFDNGLVTALDGQCDVWLAEAALFRQVNGAQLSGYVTLDPPRRADCLGGRYEPGDLAVQTGQYMCLITSQGIPGFIVVRAYQGPGPSTGIVFDYWVFP
ncbi:MAG: hypothetical protein JXB85_02580 [Anaerolineales bacterium]|nr:hypothetical protein [Anaerolineales bacterium]